MKGNAQWGTAGGVCLSAHSGTGCIRLTDAFFAGSADVTVIINFSEPVSSITLWAALFSGTATITPILDAGGTASAIPVSATGMGTGELGDPRRFTYSKFDIVGDGPYIGLEMAASTANQLAWDDLEVTLAGETSPTTARDIPTPVGDDIAVLDIDAILQVASEVVIAGSTNADFCVALDDRQVTKKNGQEKFISRYLRLSELSGPDGTCTGPLEFVDESDEFKTWEELFAVIDLRIAPWYRSYLGEVTLPGVAMPTSGYWLVLGVVRSTAEYDGPVAVVTFPETLISYANTVAAESPGCDRDLQWRNLDVGGAVEAFGDFLNIEGDRMIVETAQCNRSVSLTRRTTHVGPLRLDTTEKNGGEAVNMAWHFEGIDLTLGEAAVCADPSLIGDMLLSLNDARDAFHNGRFDDAIADLEQLARFAKLTDTGFNLCPVAANYRGNFMSRALSAAFAVHDRFLHGEAFVKYLIPADLDVPLLDPTP